MVLLLFSTCVLPLLLHVIVFMITSMPRQCPVNKNPIGKDICSHMTLLKTSISNKFILV